MVSQKQGLFCLQHIYNNGVFEIFKNSYSSSYTEKKNTTV